MRPDFKVEELKLEGSRLAETCLYPPPKKVVFLCYIVSTAVWVEKYPYSIHKYK